MQNSTQITTIWSKLQREEKFQYGGRGVARGGPGGPSPPPLESKDKKISVSCRSTEYGCDVVYIRKRLNISPIDRIYLFILEGK